jgi:nitrite reductase/ring-hydroxylating ferredoxin subunit
MCKSTSRRKFIRQISSSLIVLSLPLLTSCKDGYTRPASEFNLGLVQDLLYNQQLVREKDILVYRDDGGWSALSTQCSHEGCALSYQEERFLCTCCGSAFDHAGKVIKGPARNPLPYFEVRYADGNLYADSSRIVKADYRFTTPELEEAIQRLSERIKKEGTRVGSQIPDILLGQGDKTEVGPMFEEKKLPSSVSSEGMSESTESSGESEDFEE